MNHSTLSEYPIKNLGIIGAGESARSVAKHATSMGVNVTVFDDSTLVDFPSSVSQKKISIENIQGSNPDDIIISPWFGPAHPIVKEIRSKNIPLHSEIEYASRYIHQPIISITGTNGKTTTTALTWYLFNSIKTPALLCGNIRGSGYPEQPLTHALLQGNNSSDTLFVTEVSSAQLEHISKFKSDIAYITNLKPDHLDRYPDFNTYKQTKYKLLSSIKKEGVFILHQHHDQQVYQEIKEHLRQDISILSPDEIAPIINGQMLFHGFSLPIDSIPAVSDHFLQNIQAALTIIHAYYKQFTSQQVNTLFSAIKSFPGVEHRMEIIGSKNGVRMINNSMCTNPEAIISSCSSIHTKQHLLIGGLTKGLDFTILNSFLDNIHASVYIFGKDRYLISEMLQDRYPVFLSMKEAFHSALTSACPGENIILSPGCSSFGEFKDFVDRGKKFKELVKQSCNL